MKSGFYWGMLGAVALLGVMTAVVPSPGATARPLRFLQDTDTSWTKAEQSKQWTFSAKGKRQVRVNVEVGTISVIAGGTDQIVVSTKRIVRAKDGTVSKHFLAKAAVAVDEEAGQITVRDLFPPELRRRTRDSPRVELQVDVTVPCGMGVSSVMGVGNTTLMGQVGPVAVQTKVGDVKLERQQGVSGSIAVGTGDIHLAGEIGSLAAKTGTGEIRAKQVAATSAQSVSLLTRTGSIWAVLTALPKQQLVTRTGVGDITLEVPSALKPKVALNQAQGPGLRGLIGTTVLESVAGVGATHLDFSS